MKTLLKIGLLVTLPVWFLPYVVIDMLLSVVLYCYGFVDSVVEGKEKE